MQRKFLGIAGLLLLLVLCVAACGATATSIPVPTLEPTVAAPTTRAAVVTTLPSQNSKATTPAAAVNSGSSLTAVRGERDIVKTFTDSQGKTIKLTYGRGTGHNSDYGWAHILGKHFNGIWYDGGTITTFPQAVGAKTPEDVINLIDKSLQDKNPGSQGNGRLGYNYAVPGTNKDIFTVVGSDGTIITSYPVPHGSKDND